MNEAVFPGDTADAAVALPSFAWSVKVVRDVTTCEAEWRALEEASSISPYQRYDYISAWCRHAAGSAGIDPSIGIVLDTSGRPVMILPLGVRRATIRAASYLGGSHVNLAMPLVERHFGSTLSPPSVRALLLDYCREAGVDVLALCHQPEEWLGRPHPFLPLATRQSPDNVSRIVIDRPWDELVKSLRSSEARSKLKRKDTKLAAAGFVVEQAATPDAVERFFSAFLVQKGKRLAAMGVRDPFAIDGVREFLIDAAVSALGTNEGLQVAALRRDDVVLAVRAQLCHGREASIVVQSLDAEHPDVKHSPGEVLFARLFRRDVEAGLEHLDFGAGEEFYKSLWRNATTRLFDITLPVTPAGRAYALIDAVRGTLMVSIKRNPRLFALLKTLRTHRARWARS
jgi:CelD/BcsL family acetyltransferase involved in cellulose biosynthesis